MSQCHCNLEYSGVTGIVANVANGIWFSCVWVCELFKFIYLLPKKDVMVALVYLFNRTNRKAVDIH